MNKDDFEFQIVSSPEREKVYCEIYYKNELLAEISQESSNLLLEIYPSFEHRWWAIPFSDFQAALKAAEKHLLGMN